MGVPGECVLITTVMPRGAQRSLPSVPGTPGPRGFGDELVNLGRPVKCRHRGVPQQIWT